MILDALFGDMRWLFRAIPHPVAIIGGLASFFDKRLNRADRSDTARVVRGVLVVTVVCTLSGLAGALLAGLARQYPQAWLIELLFVAILLAQRSLFEHVRNVRRALAAGGLAKAREAVSHIVGRDPNSLDRHGVGRAAIESLAENFSDGVVAPAFWYLLFGLPGLFVYKAANTLDSMIGHRSPRHQAFGRCAARFDDVLNIVPSRLSGIILSAAAAFAPKGHSVTAWRTMWRDAPKHESPNAGWPEAAMAGAINVALQGPRKYGERRVKGEWLGESFTARATAADVGRALYLYVVACLLSLGAVSALAIAALPT